MIVNFKIKFMHRNPLAYLAGLCLAMLLAASCNQPDYQVIIRNGLIYDGNGGEPYKADIGINADTIAFIGDLSKAGGTKLIDAKGMAVSPG